MSLFTHLHVLQKKKKDLKGISGEREWAKERSRRAKHPPSKFFGSDKARPKTASGGVLSTMTRKGEEPLAAFNSSILRTFFRESPPSPGNLDLVNYVTRTAPKLNIVV